MSVIRQSDGSARATQLPSTTSSSPSIDATGPGSMIPRRTVDSTTIWSVASATRVMRASPPRSTSVWVSGNAAVER